MSSAHLTKAHMVVLIGAGGFLLAVSGCAPSYPIVANPTDPWEDELARERQVERESESNAPQAAVARQMYGAEEDEDKKSEHSPLVVAITDILGFPFRGAGWLAQHIF